MKRRITVSILMCIMCLMTGCGKKLEGRIIKAVDLLGTVTYTRENKDSDVYINMNFQAGDAVATGENSSLMMLIDSDKHVYLYADTRITMNCSGDEKNSKTFIKLESGEIYNDIDNKLSEDSQYEIETSNATIGVRGTEFYVKYQDDKTIVYCQDGTVSVKSESNEIMLPPSQAAVVEAGKAEYVEVTDIEGEILLDFNNNMNQGDASLPGKVDARNPLGVQDGYIRCKGDELQLPGLWVEKGPITSRGRTSNGGDYKIIEQVENGIIVSAERSERSESEEDFKLKFSLTYEHDGEKYVSFTVLDADGNEETHYFTEWDEDGYPIYGTTNITNE